MIMGSLQVTVLFLGVDGQDACMQHAFQMIQQEKKIHRQGHRDTRSQILNDCESEWFGVSSFLFFALFDFSLFDNFKIKS